MPDATCRAAGYLTTRQTARRSVQRMPDPRGNPLHSNVNKPEAKTEKAEPPRDPVPRGDPGCIEAVSGRELVSA